MPPVPPVPPVPLQCPAQCSLPGPEGILHDQPGVQFQFIICAADVAWRSRGITCCVLSSPSACLQAFLRCCVLQRLLSTRVHKN